MIYFTYICIKYPLNPLKLKKMKKILLLPALLIAIIVSAQNNSGFNVHEWGTFTTLQSSNGMRLAGLQKDEETLPSFVNNIAHSYYYNGFLFGPKGFMENTWFEHVTVKMETPVLYFYSDAQRNVSVNVNFKNGSISQWYPERVDGESTQYQSHLDFSQPKTGWIKWNATVLPPNSNANFSDSSNLETPQWVRPRATASNLVQGSNGEIEKFLFYRGIANFDVPVKVEFNTTGKLVITNTGSDKISYAVVYEKTNGQQANIWWSGAMDGGDYKIICKPVSATSASDLNIEMTRFEDALVNAGLFDDEAKALLCTWQESYFQHSGLKVFWIAPRSFTDSILPIAITPVPQDLQRVIVGRSEVLTVQMEQELKQGTDSAFWTAWGTDRFSEAYWESRNENINSWTNVDGSCATEVSDITNTGLNSIQIFPNPSSNEINIQSTFNEATNLNIHIFNSMGIEVTGFTETANGNYNKIISLGEYAAGIYTVKIQTDKNITCIKVIKE